jgi:Zn-dependent M28 family amino/carboxypeptidase
MSSGAWLRLGYYVAVALLFVGAMLGMFITGPVVIRVPGLDLQVEPSAERLRSTVERLCDDFFPRSHDRPDNLDRVATWVAGEFDAAGLEVEIQQYAAGPKENFRNVIGRRPGRDPSAGAIVIGAHYDSFQDSPGANDNASGVAVLLELVRTLPPVTTERTHYFVAFSTEEPPFFGTDSMGSHRFAARLDERGVDVLLMVSLDTVGYYSDEPNSQSFPSGLFRLLYPSRGNFVAVVGDARSGEAIDRVKRGMMAAGKLPVHSFRAPVSSGLVHLSDHLSFRRMGMPAVQITDTAFMRDPAYHRAEDTPERLDYARMAELVRSLHGLLWEGG